MPTLRLRRALDGCKPGAVVRLLADDPLARVDVPHFVAQQGLQLLGAEPHAPNGWAFRVRKP